MTVFDILLFGKFILIMLSALVWIYLLYKLYIKKEYKVKRITFGFALFSLLMLFFIPSFSLLESYNTTGFILIEYIIELVDKFKSFINSVFYFYIIKFIIHLFTSSVDFDNEDIGGFVSIIVIYCLIPSNEFIIELFK